MFVPGAMYARLAASVMNVPALAARPPLGATQTIAGTGRLQQRGHDPLGRIQGATGGVELHDQGR